MKAKWFVSFILLGSVVMTAARPCPRPSPSQSVKHSCCSSENSPSKTEPGSPGNQLCCDQDKIIQAADSLQNIIVGQSQFSIALAGRVESSPAFQSRTVVPEVIDTGPPGPSLSSSLGRAPPL